MRGLFFSFVGFLTTNQTSNQLANRTCPAQLKPLPTFHSDMPKFKRFQSTCESNIETAVRLKLMLFAP